MKDDDAIEAEIQAKGLTAPRLTPDLIESKVKGTWFVRVPDTTMTICVLTLENGFQVTGESAAASPENFDQAIGCQIALQNAKQKIWQLEGYRLKQALFEEAISAEIIRKHAAPAAQAGPVSHHPV